MPLTTQDLLARLAELGIETTTVEHPPLFTVEDSQALRGDIPGGHTKNLFLKDKKGNIFLVVVEEETRVDLKSLHQPLGAASRLSFGSAELLEEVLGVKPGAVTAFGPVNDTEGRVTVVLDAELMTHETVNCHPLVNTATTAIRSADLIRFLRTTGHEPLVMAVPRRTDAAEEG
ncbi:YbaK/prolyl-tRNA synthetase associated region [Ancylobacter novellus DSM 506]|uniref:YbaK/prolyl-tRNA synthetase associated region n=1 Tax=Ancylobacter novellus (strain ATCC 8093 / DSM 506 / JCM 20403 / CCM 1077 / IAM 12100 / NBRC 12443 / NCIMB 10456) TaxID=639283 RepID=D7A9D6_ANCN5|nr:prolyl-tRNA synthetase associated domain-containing protein [Ancylobacter novellus]ADH90698.1 YbaK/prolyl-tRNA synthetase associated region [Ancylobacter novellus DSM 506]